MTKIAVDNEEARLIAVYRALDKSRYGDKGEASDAAAWLPAVVDIEKHEKSSSESELEVLLEGYIAGLSVGALRQIPELTAEQLIAQYAEKEYEATDQTGVDPVTNKVR